MSIIYPKSPEECPNYFDNGATKWRDEVRHANKFGIKKTYNIGDTVETMSFYFPNSEVHTQNEVIIEKGKIESIYEFKSGGFSYTVLYPNGCGKITSISHLRPA